MNSTSRYKEVLETASLEERKVLALERQAAAMERQAALMEDQAAVMERQIQMLGHIADPLTVVAADIKIGSLQSKFGQMEARRERGYAEETDAQAEFRRSYITACRAKIESIARPEPPLDHVSAKYLAQ
ncbi:hypothetical protein CPCC7001_2589 [Cyanobium sp. PCC 7001]|uniref:hypothetical protein n=1 Tax=Cyanobium sp. PCC 7001 TaxID=180281 RepID=UPI0001805BD3|nr:hypothetical protein [Cyanobium sp. PCC 7001]EDY39708.1 hypothetical protein CPCC7001_2589 [Cyanobium sp. PCC 7001]